MKPFLLLIITFLFLNSFQLRAQDSLQTAIQNDKVSMGMGIGPDMGGLGINLLYYPQKNIGLFAGAGFALAGMGVNGGMKFRTVSKNRNSKYCPFVIAMYGYNAGVYIQNSIEHNKLFYGPTLGLGLDLRSRGKKGYWSIAILYPIRKSSEIEDYMNHLEDSHHAIFNSEYSLLPLSFSVSYRILGNQ